MISVWRSVPFDEAVEDASGGNFKTPQGDYLESGSLPIVDQGEALVGGYSNDPGATCRVALPVVVFGDHTRRLKYVDFSFGMGADGVKVLKPRPGIDAKYLYHYLRSLELPAAGYDRHFKYLKRVVVEAPTLAEQRQIAKVLDRAETLRIQRRQALTQLDALAEAIFLDMFGEPDSTASSWQVVPLEEAVRAGTIVTYGIVQAGDEVPNGVPYIRTGDLVDGEIVADGLRRTDPEIAGRFSRSRVDAGDIVMSIRATVGTTAVVPPELAGANLTQGTARIAPGDRALGPYLLHFLRTRSTQHWIQQQVKGATFREITLSRLRELPTLLPPLELQQTFAMAIAVVDRLRLDQRRAQAELDALFASLQHRAFRGEL